MDDSILPVDLRGPAYILPKHLNTTTFWYLLQINNTATIDGFHRK